MTLAIGEAIRLYFRAGRGGGEGRGRLWGRGGVVGSY